VAIDPFTVIVRVPFGGLGKIMMKTRVWLDDQKIELFEFTTKLNAGGYSCRYRFRKIADADQFRAEFVGAKLTGRAGHAQRHDRNQTAATVDALGGA
jgi:hypothetical protein